MVKTGGLFSPVAKIHNPELFSLNYHDSHGTWNLIINVIPKFSEGIIRQGAYIWYVYWFR
jgi:uncharacterized membrane protein